jgi:hypothetical protein
MGRSAPADLLRRQGEFFLDGAELAEEGTNVALIPDATQGKPQHMHMCQHAREGIVKVCQGWGKVSVFG